MASTRAPRCLPGGLQVAGDLDAQLAGRDDDQRLRARRPSRRARRRRCSIGTPKPRVLPVPVRAWPMRSWPASAIGRVSSWIANGAGDADVGQGLRRSRASTPRVGEQRAVRLDRARRGERRGSTRCSGRRLLVRDGCRARRSSVGQRQCHRSPAHDSRPCGRSATAIRSAETRAEQRAATAPRRRPRTRTVDVEQPSRAASASGALAVARRRTAPGASPRSGRRR